MKDYCLKYYPYVVIGFIDNIFFLIVQDKLSVFLINHLYITNLSATIISGTISSSFSFFVGLCLNEKTKNPHSRINWFHQWMALTLGNISVCIISLFIE